MTDVETMARGLIERSQYDLLEAERDRCLELARDCEARKQPRTARFFRGRAAELTAELAFTR